MRIFGIDFTSAPSNKKPIALADGELCGARLEIRCVSALESFGAFEDMLHAKGPWFAGIDFPFGQPRRLIENVHWPRSSWLEYMAAVGQMSRPEFVSLLREYQGGRPRGDVRHFRHVDRIARSCSPMQLDFIPVARMFFEGAPRLLNSPCSVYPFYSKADNSRIVVEAYPALVARACIGNRSYKSDNKEKWTTERKKRRQAILNGLCATGGDGPIQALYGLKVAISPELAERVIEDCTADKLDSVLCAAQAAWAYNRRNEDFGLYLQCDPLEGWIADPAVTPR